MSGSTAGREELLLTSEPTAFCPFKTFPCKACPRIKFTDCSVTKAIIQTKKHLLPARHAPDQTQVVLKLKFDLFAFFNILKKVQEPLILRTRYTCRVQNRTYHSRFVSAWRMAGRRAAAGCGMVRRGWAEQDADRSSSPKANRPYNPQECRGQLSWTSFDKHK